MQGASSSIAATGHWPNHYDKRSRSEVLEAYVERVLASTLRVGRVVVVERLSAHKGQRVRKPTEHGGCELLYLAPYSPDPNPMEEAFSKVELILGRLSARAKEVLTGAIGRALGTVGTEDVRGFFAHHGYRAPVQ